MKTPSKVSSLLYFGCCVSLKASTVERLMKGATIANKKKLNMLIKEHYPEIYDDLALDLYNPYDYYKTKTHLILVNSSIEYFFEYKI